MNQDSLDFNRIYKIFKSNYKGTYEVFKRRSPQRGL
jgi:hypothetical protein